MSPHLERCGCTPALPGSHVTGTFDFPTWDSTSIVCILSSTSYGLPQVTSTTGLIPTEKSNITMNCNIVQEIKQPNI